MIALRTASFSALLMIVAGGASAQISDDVIKIGVLNDQSGLYSDLTGYGAVVAARMAVEDFGGHVSGASVDVIFADHQNKPDIGAGIAREWLDNQGVDAIADVPTSSVALAVNEIVRDKNKVWRRMEEALARTVDRDHERHAPSPPSVRPSARQVIYSGYMAR